jgi:hypothetical protein
MSLFSAKATYQLGRPSQQVALVRAVRHPVWQLAKLLRPALIHGHHQLPVHFILPSSELGSEAPRPSAADPKPIEISDAASKGQRHGDLLPFRYRERLNQAKEPGGLRCRSQLPLENVCMPFGGACHSPVISAESLMQAPHCFFMSHCNSCPERVIGPTSPVSCPGLPFRYDDASLAIEEASHIFRVQRAVLALIVLTHVALAGKGDTTAGLFSRPRSQPGGMRPRKMYQ